MKKNIKEPLAKKLHKLKEKERKNKLHKNSQFFVMKFPLKMN